ncbi:hypothetical protein TWF788_000465 [Orbilia oligospora]|uniref:TOM core complex subunit Tom6 n=1 Tax=Orbilia oligospora TaxID=2813651 RepID=A0A6G1MPB7_ORBOL|nr:hypothetical protein TWF788_000465 [Orbilia oligospora]KAF3214559.1 hypothetical protein TWF191_009737 [Orbilia oligospora]KAF3215851.1 hypothetical protein TWF679_003692 [Orbilia oligospora]KAF3263529.1 hypothetical protein TWF192_005808 [Orbilia oligospora]
MAPKRASGAPSAIRAPHQRSQPSVLTQTYRFVTNSENASMIRSVAAFGVAVAFLHSSFAELLVPSF